MGNCRLARELWPKYDQFTGWPWLRGEEEGARVLQELGHGQIIGHDVHLVKKTEIEKRKLTCLKS